MIPLKQVIEHYGNAILAVVVLLALGAIIVSALATGGYIDLAFKDLVTGFFGDMNGVRGVTP